MFQSTFISRGHSGGGLLEDLGFLVGMIVSDQPPYASALLLPATIPTLRDWGYPVEWMDPKNAVDPASGASYGSLLNAAAARGDIAAIRYALAVCSDPNVIAHTGYTPLAEASRHGQVEAVRFLLAAGARLDGGSKDGQTIPLSVAASAGRTEVIQVLLSQGDKVDRKDARDWTALHFAARFGQVSAATLLLQNGADVNAKNDDGDTPLYLAAHGSHGDLTRVLIGLGAAVNVRNRLDDTPLHRVARSGDSALGKMLLEKGADANAVSKFSRTPLDELQERDGFSYDPEFEALLRSHGAKTLLELLHPK
jgi:ankyrin repeat protein